MHKSWGNAIEFDEAADRMGVDVMRWMFAKARPEENILFGWHAADEARRELLVLWNVYAFFVTYARLAGWTPAEARAAAGRRAARRSIAGSCRGPRAPRPSVEDRLRDVDARRRHARAVDVPRRPLDLVPAPVAPAVLALATTPPTASAAFATLHAALVATARMLAPILPFLADTMYGNLVTDGRCRGARQRPPDDAGRRPTWPAIATSGSRRAMAMAQRAVDLARTLRSANRPQDPPAAGAGLAGRARSRRGRSDRSCSTSSPSEINVKVVERHRRRLGARRAPGQAAAAEDRQAARARRSRRSWPRPARAPSNSTTTAR